MDIENPDVEKNEDLFETEKDTKPFRKPLRLRPAAIIGLSLLVLLLIIAASVVLAEKSDIRAKKHTEDSVFSVNADTVIDIAPFPSGAALLTATSIEYVDQYGNLMNANEHTFSKPVMVTAGKNLILYDRGGSQLKIEKNSVKYKQLEFESAISCADITENGVYSYVLNADSGYQSHMFAYSYKGSLLFEWSSADYVLCMSLAPSGKYAALGVLSVENAEYNSKVFLFQFNRKEPIYSVDFNGETVYDVEFTGTKKLAVFTDHGTYLLDRNGEKTAYAEYTANEMNHTSVTKDGVGVSAVNLYGNNNNVIVRIFTKGFRSVYEHSFQEAVVSVVSGENAAALIMNDRILIYNDKDVQIGVIEPPEACIRCILSGSRVFVLTSGGLYNFSMHQNNGESQ